MTQNKSNNNKKTERCATRKEDGLMYPGRVRCCCSTCGIRRYSWEYSI